MSRIKLLKEPISRSEKNIFTVIFVVKSLKGFCWINVDPASQTVAQHYIIIGPMYRVIWCSWRRDVKASPSYCSRQKTRYNHPMLFQWRASFEDCGSTLKQHWCLRKVYNRPGDRLVLGQRRRRLTGIKTSMGCNAGPTLNRNFVGRPTSSVPGTA